MSPSARELYGPLFRAIRRTAEERGRTGIRVEQVAAAIEDAMAGLRPRTHYIVGKVAWQIAFLSLLPDGMRDRLVLNHLGL